MDRLRFTLHIAEPFDFARQNEGMADLPAWTTQATAALSDWVLHLDRPARLGDDAFGKVKITARYAGERVAKVLSGHGYTGVNISYPRRDECGQSYWHFAMVGSIQLAEGARPC